MTTRRHFLQCGLGAALLPLVSGSAAARRSPRKLIIALAYGGWDTMWALDPKPDHPEVDKIPGAIRLFGEMPIWVHQDRPAVTRFFEQWGSVSTVVNGIAVESLAHESCIDVMLTGALASDRPDLPTRLAKAHGTQLPLPYLSLSPQMENHGFEAHTGMLGDSNQLMSLANPSFNFPAPGTSTPDLGLEFSQQEQVQVTNYLRQAAASMQAKTQPSSVAHAQLADYQVAMAHGLALTQQARQPGLLSDAALFSQANAGWRHVPAAFKDNLSLTAMIQPQLYWDTHAYNAEQGKAYETFFSGLDLMMRELHAAKILETTDVLILSEMGRTPMHNKDEGKDHWPWTSAMLVSTQVSGGRVLGQSDALLRPGPIDLATGAADPKGKQLHAEHILGAVAKLHGVAPETWYPRGSFDALLA